MSGGVAVDDEKRHAGGRFGQGEVGDHDVAVSDGRHFQPGGDVVEGRFRRVLGVLGGVGQGVLEFGQARTVGIKVDFPAAVDFFQEIAGQFRRERKFARSAPGSNDGLEENISGPIVHADNPAYHGLVAGRADLDRGDVEIRLDKVAIR